MHASRTATTNFLFFPFIVDSTVTVFRGLNFEYIPVSLEARAPLTVLLAPAIVNGIPRGSLLTRGDLQADNLQKAVNLGWRRGMTARESRK